MSGAGSVSRPRSMWKMPWYILFRDVRALFKKDALGLEIIQIAVPAAMALAADPIASLIDTAFIGRLGPVMLAAVGVSIAVFNQVSKIAIFPLVSITTSFVAEEDAIARCNLEAHEGEKIGKDAHKSTDMNVEVQNVQTVSQNTELAVALEDLKANKSKSSVTTSIPHCPKSKGEKRNIASASTALIIGGVLGLCQALILVLAAKPLLILMGAKHGSPMLAPAQEYLIRRALGAPAVLLSLAMQGVFRGFKDTKTPLYATVVGDVSNVILDPILIFYCKLGIRGAAISHVISQYIISLILFWILMKKVNLLTPSFRDLQLNRFLKNGSLLLARVVAVSFCVTLASSMAARLGPTQMAAFQICLQVWLTSSLLADGLAVAVQAILACSFAEKDHEKAISATSRVLQMSSVLGLALVVVVGVGLQFGAKMFSSNSSVLHFIHIGIPFVAATQPINTLAFIFDGMNFGASDFAYSAYSMVLVAIASIVCVVVLAKAYGFVGIWIALTIYMCLRALTGIWRISTATGPWHFLRGGLVS